MASYINVLETLQGRIFHQIQRCESKSGFIIYPPHVTLHSYVKNIFRCFTELQCYLLFFYKRHSKQNLSRYPLIEELDS